MEDIERIHREYVTGRRNEHKNKVILVDAILKSIQANPPKPDLSDERFTLLDECIASINVKALYAPNRDLIIRLRGVLEKHRFYRNGKTLEQIAQWYGVSRQSVHQAFTRYGLPIRPIHESKLDVQTNNN